MDQRILDSGAHREPGALSSVVRLGYAIGEFAIASHMSILSIYLLYYLTEVHRFPAATAGTLILLPRLWNIVSDPLMGGISDRVKTRWGRRRPFLLAGGFVWGVSYTAMFWIPEHITLLQKGIWFFVSCFAVNTGLSLYHVPYSAMVPEMTRSVNERVRLLSYKEMAARGSVLVTVLFSPLIVAAGPTPLIGYRWVGLAAGSLIFLSGLMAFTMTAKAPAVAFQPQTMSWREQIRTFRQNKGFLRLAGVYLFSSAADAFYSALFIYFITVSMKLPGGLMGALYPIGSLTAILMTTVWGRFSRRIGRRAACMLAFIGAMATFSLSLAVPVSAAWLLYPFMILVGGFFAGLFLLPGSMVPDAVDEDEQVCGHRREGTIYGAWIFTQQTGMALGSFLVGVYLDVVGYRSGEQIASPHQAELLRAGFALGPVVLIGIGLLILRTVPLGDRIPRQP